jgi:hypothetical protein
MFDMLTETDRMMRTQAKRMIRPFRQFNPSLWLAFLFLLPIPMVAHAAGPMVEKPIYFEGTGSYYEMIDYRPTTGGYGLRWEQAEKLASQKMLGGVKGRLALIQSPETELFLKINLRPDHATWFGLYFDCDSRKFFWIDGTQMENTDYANFVTTNWFREPTGTICSDYRGYRRYPVFLDMGGDKRWAVRGPTKLFYYYIIEYPTGGRIKDDGAHEATNIPAASQTE